MDYPRVLIVSNDCLSQSSSNGRTLRNFLLGWPRDRLAQFYIQNNMPDFTVCANYYRVTDGQALRAFLGRGCGGGVVEEAPTGKEVPAPSAPAGKCPGRNALTMLARELVWNSGRWKTEDFRRWTDAFRPEVILLQAGDCGFMLRLAEQLSEQYRAPLVIYNSEGYCFKDFDYFRARGLAHWCYPVFSRHLRRQYRRVLPKAARSVYICEPLQREYDRAFGLPSETIYTATEVRPRAKAPENPVFRASYLGSLGVGRHQVLMEVGRALHDVSEALYLDVYGPVPNEEARQALEDCPGVRYRGVVPYSEVLEVMAQSDLLVHAESFEPFYREDLKFAFSTKLADSLASGVCFLLYAPEELACTQYLRENNAAWVVSDPAKLGETLRTLVERPVERARHLASAAALVERNHDAGKNTARFRSILEQAAERGQP